MAVPEIPLCGFFLQYIIWKLSHIIISNPDTTMSKHCHLLLNGKPKHIKRTGHDVEQAG
jgi:hypothetical protein